MYNSTELFHQLIVLANRKSIPSQDHSQFQKQCRVDFGSPPAAGLWAQEQGHAAGMRALLWHCFLSLPAMWSGEYIGLLMGSMPEEGQNGPRALLLGRNYSPLLFFSTLAWK